MHIVGSHSWFVAKLKPNLVN